MASSRPLSAADKAAWRGLWRGCLTFYQTEKPEAVVQATFAFGIAILAEAALSYLGLGTQPPAPSWGVMLRDAQSFIDRSPWATVFPGVVIAITVLGLNLLGDGLRDQLDPRGR